VRLLPQNQEGPVDLRRPVARAPPALPKCFQRVASRPRDRPSAWSGTESDPSQQDSSRRRGRKNCARLRVGGSNPDAGRPLTVIEQATDSVQEEPDGPAPSSERRSVWQSLMRGLPGHPLHPPFTDATIGMFTLAAGLGIIGSAGVIQEPAGRGMWLALIGGLIAALPTAATGFADWVTIPWGTPRWRAATLHLGAMLLAVTVFALAAWQQYAGYLRGHVVGTGLWLTLAGFAILMVGGWLGGSIVFVHGMRVLRRTESTDGDRGTDFERRTR
jgi:uncharacterized membrane protein